MGDRTVDELKIAQVYGVGVERHKIDPRPKLTDKIRKVELAATFIVK